MTCSEWFPVSVHLQTIAGGSTAIITKTYGEQLDEPVIVYNFKVSDFHTYYVTDTGVLVHNDSGCVDTSPPNPNGKKGSKEHQDAIDNIKATEADNIIKREEFFPVENGYKSWRYADAVEVNKNGDIVAIYQVGNVNNNGTPVIRESRAMEDIFNSIKYNDVPIYFIPYNSDIASIVYYN